jgi:hypothetical protein
LRDNRVAFVYSRKESCATIELLLCASKKNEESTKSELKTMCEKIKESEDEVKTIDNALKKERSKFYC